MKFIKGSLAGPAFAGILAMIPAAAFAQGGGGHAFGGFTGHGLNPRFSGTRVFSAGRSYGREDHGRFGDRGFRDHRVFLQRFAWPAYGSPYYPYDNSYLGDGPDNDYQDGDNSAPSVQPESSTPAVDHGPVVVIPNAGNSRPMDSRASTEYIHNGYGSRDAAGQPGIVMQDSNEKIGPRADPRTFVLPAVPQPSQTPANGAQTRPQTPVGVFGKLVLVSWLVDGGKDVIYVQNTETNEVQKITSRPNLDNFRIVELHPNADPKLSEAVISNGVQQGPVRFRF
jgi:hypothetical protein